MPDAGSRSAKRRDRDRELTDIADYVCDAVVDSDLAFEAAHFCLMDSLACGFQALAVPACTKLLGPVVPGATLSGGARVPGTSYELDPVTAAFNIGAMIRWLDVNDARLAAEWGHPSDNLGGILAVADYLGRRNRATGRDPLLMRDVLTAMIKAYEIQGCLVLDNSFNRVGLDHALLVRVASTAVVTRMLGGERETVLNALSHAWIDGGALQSYRHAPNTGSRKRRAAADAASRAVHLALIVDRLTTAVEEDVPAAEPRLDAPHGRMATRFPGGYWERRGEDIPVLGKKFVDSVSPRLGAGQWEALEALSADRDKLAATAVDDFMALLVA